MSSTPIYRFPANMERQTSITYRSFLFFLFFHLKKIIIFQTNAANQLEVIRCDTQNRKQQQQQYVPVSNENGRCLIMASVWLSLIGCN